MGEGGTATQTVIVNIGYVTHGKEILHRQSRESTPYGCDSYLRSYTDYMQHSGMCTVQ